ncbi:MAG: HlyC/CorC family transporter [Chlamydiales bacterium]|nr:HlyC/CorC family transporter [Chlamydiales bacterium]
MDWKFYLILLLVCLVVQGFYSMLEMACVSFNKVRLQYYVSQGNRRAKWLTSLLKRPAILFGTTLIGVNLTLQLGSESARRLYESIGINPDFAPISQWVLVLLFAEIAPLFAGRRYAEHVVMLGIPFIYASSILLRPVIWGLDLLCSLINRLVGSPKDSGLYLTRDELQKMLEEQEVRPYRADQTELSSVAGRIFSLKTKIAKEMMKPLTSVNMIPSICTIAEMRALLSAHYSPFLPIFHRTPQNIVAIAYPRDLLRFPENARVREHARPPWFITENTSILQLLKQFRRNNKSIAIVLNQAGLAVGILTLDEILDEIFGQSDSWPSINEMAPRAHHVMVDRTFPGDMTIKEFNQQFNVHLPDEGVETLEELVTKHLGHPPSKGETIRIDQFELTVEEASLLGAKMISIQTVY